MNRKNRSSLVLFGCGTHTFKFLELLSCISREADYIADNDEKKVGKEYEGIPVIAPQELISMDCEIIISCTFFREITAQLTEMGIQSRIRTIKELLEQWRGEKPQALAGKKKLKEEQIVFADLFSGCDWGGAENWNLNIAWGLKRAGERVEVLADDVVKPDWRDQKTGGIPMKRFYKNEGVSDIAEYFTAHLPFVFINSFMGKPFFAALVLKALYPDLVRILDVVHIDKKEVYDLHVQFHEMVDGLIGVSSKITERLVEAYGIKADRVCFKEQLIDTDKSFQKMYTNACRPLKLGYAARLVKEQKRADLLSKLIEELEKCRINYELEIAGEGECEEELQNFISEHKLSSKIRLTGQLGREEMKEFWKRQDVYLNISEYEGASLAMLESMGFGCIPVVTDVSGVRDFIKNEENGFICSIGDLHSMARAVSLLSDNRGLLQQYGEKARKEVIERCSAEQYISFLRWLIKKKGCCCDEKGSEDKNREMEKKGP